MAAAMKAKLASLVTAIETKEAWDECVAGLEGRLLVVDVHKKWCGPCTVVRPTFERIYIDLENQDKRIKFVSAHEESGVDDEALAARAHEHAAPPLPADDVPLDRRARALAEDDAVVVPLDRVPADGPLGARA